MPSPSEQDEASCKSETEWSLTDILDRLRDLECMDRDLDEVLARINGWRQPSSNGAWAKDYGGDVGVRWLISAPNYTGSVDAALEFIPPGWELGEVNRNVQYESDVFEQSYGVSLDRRDEDGNYATPVHAETHGGHDLFPCAIIAAGIRVRAWEAKQPCTTAQALPPSGAGQTEAPTAESGEEK